MPKSKQKKATAIPKAYRFVLPRDTEKVRQIAFAGAMDCAYVLFTRKEPSDAVLLAATLANTHEKAEENGKRGCNEPMVFWQIFAEIVPRIYPAMLKLLEDSPEMVTSIATLSQAARINQWEAYAAKNLALLATPADQPIEMHWD